MDSTLKKFFAALDFEEADFLSTLATQDGDLILRTAVNELDWLQYSLQHKDLDFDEQEGLYILSLGVARLIKLTLDSRDSPELGYNLIRDERRSIPVLEIASGLGMIQHGRRIAQTVSAGLCAIHAEGDSDFVVTLPAVVPDDEYYERAVCTHYQEQSRRAFQEVLSSRKLQKVKVKVDRLLRDLVYPFQEHFIGYGAHRILDDYFFALAYSEVQLADGVDNFPHAARFGGVSFRNYLLGLVFIVSLYIRHERFAVALVEKSKRVKMENILTITAEVRGMVQSIRYAINHFGSVYAGFEAVSLEQAHQIFSVLSVSKETTKLLDAPAVPMPLLVQYSREGVLRCLSGARDHPVQFLLNSLRYRFTADYSREQQTRENVMQRAIKRVLDRVFPGLTYSENIEIKLDGRAVTDIDLVLTEATSGAVVLCQLKHQDPYASDLNARRVRSSRLREEGGRWLGSIDRWLARVGDGGVRSSLRLTKSFPPPTIYRVLIAKHYAHPLTSLTQRPDAACGTWPQFFNAVRLVKGQAGRVRSLHDLIATLKKMEAPGGRQEHEAGPPTKWTIRGLTFRVCQSED